MKTRRKSIVTALLGITLSLVAGNASAETKASTGRDGTEAAGVDEKRVSLELSGGTVADALMSVAKQAEWELAIGADQADLQKNFTLIVKDKPAKDVLDIIAATTPLEMEMKNGVLIVRSKSDAAPQVKSDTADEDAGDTGRLRKDRKRQTWRERFDEHQRYWKKRKKRVEFGAPVTVNKDEHLETAVSIGHDTIISGHIDRDAVSIGGTLTVKRGAVVEGSAVSVGGNVIIEPGATIGDEAVAIGGTVSIDGGAAVGGDAVAVGGTVTVAEDAVLEGDRVSIGIPMPTVGGIAGAIGGIMILNAIGAVARSVFFFAVALLLIWLIPMRVDAVKSYMEQRPGRSILSGFLLFLALVPLFIVLAITIIGIPLIPVAALALAGLMFLGFTAVIVWLGERSPVFREHRTPFKVLLIGFVVFMLANIVPILGGIFLLIAAFAGVGASFLSRFGGREVA